MSEKVLTEEKRDVLVLYPPLAEALDELIEEYGLDLVKDALEEIIQETEGG